MKVRSQLILSNGLLLALLLVVAGVLYQSVQNLILSATGVTHSHQVISNVHHLEKLLVDTQSGQRGYLLTGKDSELTRYSSARKAILPLLDRTRELVSDNLTQVDRLRRVESLHDSWLRKFGEPEIEVRRKIERGELPMEALGVRLQGRKIDDAGTSSNFDRTGKETMDELRSVLAAVIKTERELLTKRNTLNAEASTFTGSAAILGAAAASLLSLILGFSLIRNLSLQLGAEPEALNFAANRILAGDLRHEIADLSKAAEHSVASNMNTMITSFADAARQANAIANGDLSSDVRILGPDDILGNALQRMTEQLREVTHKNETVHWLKHSESEFSDLLRGDPGLEVLGARVLRYCANHLRIVASTFYVLEENSLRIVADKGLADRSVIDEIIALGVGPLGEAVLQRELLEISPVPASHLTVRTSLGRSAPVHLAIVPFAHDEDSLGVMELASFHPFEKSVIEFLERIAPHIAVAIMSSQGRDHMQTLVAKMRIQTRALAERETELQRINQNLEDSQVALEKSNDGLYEFAHAAAHDLKAPLRHVRRWLETIQDEFGEKLPDDALYLVGRADHSASRMERLITGLLEFAQLGSSTPEMLVVNMQVLFEQIRTEFDDTEHDAGARIIVGELPAALGNHTLLFQLFQNLYGNALKYRREDVPPEIRISGKHGPDGKTVRYEIVDNGIGFDQAQAESIFQPFKRLVGDSKYEGSGIGMATALKIAKAHKGTISAIGEKGKGATFRVCLPSPDAHAFTLLVVDDDTEQLEQMNASFKETTIQLLTAGTGAEALELIRTTSVHAVLSDYQMPEMDGVSLLTEIRNLFPDIRRFLTSSVTPPKLKSLRNTGVVEEFWPKDINVSELVKTLENRETAA